MDWKALGKKVVKLGAPLLGTALGGPGGGAVGAIVGNMFGVDSSDPSVIDAAISADPQALVKLKEIQLEHKVELERIALEHTRIESEERRANLAQVNETMRAESKSEHWMQFSWRPFNGFCFPVATIAIYFILPLAKVPVPDVPPNVWLGWLTILGVATWDRGKQKRIQAGEQKTGLIASAIQAIKAK